MDRVLAWWAYRFKYNCGWHPIQIWIAQRLPNWMIYRAGIVLMSKACEANPDLHPLEVTIHQALQASAWANRSRTDSP